MSFEMDRPPDAGFDRPRPGRSNVIRGDVDESFRQSMADLSRQLAARTAPSAPLIDPQLDVERAPERAEPERAEPEQPEPRRQVARRRSLAPVMAFALGVAIAAGIHAFLAKAPPPPQAPSVAAATSPPEAPPQPTVTAVAPPPPMIVDPPPATAPVVVPAPEPVAPAPQGKLEIYEVMEMQTRLKAIGLYPGPLDGVVGTLTKAAIKRYETSKNQPQTGKLDRELLKQLRREPDRSASSR